MIEVYTIPIGEVELFFLLIENKNSTKISFQR